MKFIKLIFLTIFLIEIDKTFLQEVFIDPNLDFNQQNLNDLLTLINDPLVDNQPQSLLNDNTNDIFIDPNIFDSLNSPTDNLNFLPDLNQPVVSYDQIQPLVQTDFNSGNLQTEDDLLNLIYDDLTQNALPLNYEGFNFMDDSQPLQDFFNDAILGPIVPVESPLKMNEIPEPVYFTFSETLNQEPTTHQTTQFKPTETTQSILTTLININLNTTTKRIDNNTNSLGNSTTVIHKNVTNLHIVTKQVHNQTINEKKNLTTFFTNTTRVLLKMNSTHFENVTSRGLNGTSNVNKSHKPSLIGKGGHGMHMVEKRVHEPEAKSLSSSKDFDLDRHHHHHHYHNYTQTFNYYQLLWIGTTIFFIVIVIVAIIVCPKVNKENSEN
ncbi:unnamed protein product [Brachionus calyciflorus]|uniref:Uncharacterized protein n=1 Tax=Brachionus calyciflorus TaxID=104777 RepID=A0A813VPR3_9BILA|nr:unnamed protein product [Brachionus calyciflorus]